MENLKEAKMYPHMALGKIKELFANAEKIIRMQEKFSESDFV